MASQSSMNSATERLEPPNEHSHIVLPTGEQSTSRRASSHDSVVAAYPHGISLIDQMGAMEGYLTIIGGFGLAAALSFLYISVWILDDPWGAFFLAILACICTAMLRSDSVGYHYQPALFDRANGKIHVFVDEGITWWKLWELTPRSRIDTWDWSCARAEVAEFIVVAGSGVPRREYALVCAVTDQPGSRKVAARFGIGLTSSHDGGQAMVERWEHIRRFMNEDGPHLAPGDSLFLDESTHKLWAALTWGQPLLGPGSKIWWTGEAINGCWFFTIPAGIFFLIFLPFSIVAGLLRLLSHAAKREPKWTKDILAGVGGAKLDMAALTQRQSNTPSRKPTKGKA
jgi:hypothetical protein